MVYWWNKLKFADLSAVGEYLAPVAYFARYTEYCRLKAKGLRRPGLDALDRFVSEVEGWETSRQRQLAHWVARVSTRFTAPTEFCPHPLAEHLMAVCRQWGEDTPDPRPFCCIGILHGDTSAFREALRRDPRQDYARKQLLQQHVYQLEWATDQLPHFFYGIPEEILADSVEGVSLAKGFVNVKLHAALVDQFHTMRRQTVDWVRAQAARGRQSYWSPYIRMQRKKNEAKDDFD